MLSPRDMHFSRSHSLLRRHSASKLTRCQPVVLLWVLVGALYIFIYRTPCTSSSPKHHTLLNSVQDESGNSATDRIKKHASNSCIRIGILSAFPPQTGYTAKFAGGLYTNLASLVPSSSRVEVLAVDEKTLPLKYGPEVTVVMGKESEKEYVEAATYANKNLDIILCIHEDSIFGGEHGEFLFAFLHTLRLPVVYVLHAEGDPPLPYRAILEGVVHSATRVLVKEAGICLDLQVMNPPTMCNVLPLGLVGRPDKVLDLQNRAWRDLAARTLKYLQKDSTFRKKASCPAVTGWWPGTRQGVLKQGFTLMYSQDLGHRDCQLAVGPLLEVLSLPSVHPTMSVARASCAAIVRALSTGHLLFSRWLPPPHKVQAMVERSGQFFCTNGLFVLHGDLRSGAVFHTKPQEGLLFGRGVKYAGMFVEFTLAGQRHRVPVQDNISKWGHKVEFDRVTFQMTKCVALSRGRHVGEVTHMYTVKEGSQELQVTFNFTASADVEGGPVSDVAIITGMDYLSKLYPGLVYNRMYLYTRKEGDGRQGGQREDGQGQVELRSGQDPTETLYARSERAVQWHLLTDGAGHMGLFTVLQSSSLLQALEQRGNSDENYHYVFARYEVKDPVEQSFVICERRWLVGTVQLKHLADYNSVFENPPDFLGIDMEARDGHQKFLQFLNVSHYD
eukprot:jgi/Mesen1/1980/ME000147S01074